MVIERGPSQIQSPKPTKYLLSTPDQFEKTLPGCSADPAIVTPPRNRVPDSSLLNKRGHFIAERVRIPPHVGLLSAAATDGQQADELLAKDLAADRVEKEVDGVTGDEEDAGPVL